jgi:hypothetical protein
MDSNKELTFFEKRQERMKRQNEYNKKWKKKNKEKHNEYCKKYRLKELKKTFKSYEYDKSSDTTDLDSDFDIEIVSD